MDKPQVDVVPRNASVSAPLRRRAGNHARVRVPFCNVASRLKSEVVERVRELADASTDGGDQAALAQFAAGHVASGFGRAPELSPETELAPGFDQRAIEP